MDSHQAIGAVVGHSWGERTIFCPEERWVRTPGQAE